MLAGLSSACHRELGKHECLHVAQACSDGGGVFGGAVTGVRRWEGLDENYSFPIIKAQIIFRC